MRSESCGITGLEIKAGDPAWFVVLDCSMGTGSGPTWDHSLVTPPVRGVYDGEGGVEADVSTPEADARVQLYHNILGISRRMRDVLSKRQFRDNDHRVFLVADSTMKFLPELPQLDTELGATVGAERDARAKQIREVVMPHVANETTGQSGDPYSAAAQWRELEATFAHQIEGTVDLQDWCSTYYHDKEQMEVLITADADLYTLYSALRETRKVFAPCTDALMDSGGHKAVGELARFVRRKAIAAGFNGED